MTMNPFAGTGDVDFQGRGNRFEPGEYDVTIERVFANNGHKGLTFIVEFKIDTSSSASPSLAPGGTASWVRVGLTTPATAKMAKAEIKGFFCGVAGLTPADQHVIAPIVDAAAMAACGADNPLAGQKLHVSARASEKADPKTGKPYVNCSFLGGSALELLRRIASGGPAAPAAPAVGTRVAPGWVMGPAGAPVPG